MRTCRINCGCICRVTIVSTVAYLGWDGLKNGELLRAAETEGFEVLVTGDKNISYQQNLKERRIGLLVLSAQDWPTISQNFLKLAPQWTEPPLGRFRT